METGIRNQDFAAKLALTYAELFDGVSPSKARVSVRIDGAYLEIRNAETHAVDRWHLDEMREVPDQSDGTAVIFAPDDIGDARLVIRETEALRALAESGASFTPLKGPPGQWRRLGFMGALAAACFGGLLFGLVPWFADRASAHIPVAAEQRIGQDLITLAYDDRFCTDPAGKAALDTMTTTLTEGTELPLPVAVQVVRDPAINAFALPGGQVAIHSGLLQAAETPEEVAAVVAHEIGHVVHRDPTRAQLRAMGSYGLVGLLFGDVLGMSGAAGVSGLATQAIDASYSRSAERAADAYAHERLVAAGQSPEALASFFARMEAETGEVDLGALRHLSTHPEFAERIEAARGAERGPVGDPILTAAEWSALQGICGQVGGAGPAPVRSTGEPLPTKG